MRQNYISDTSQICCKSAWRSSDRALSPTYTIREEIFRHLKNYDTINVSFLQLVKLKVQVG